MKTVITYTELPLVFAPNTLVEPKYVEDEVEDSLHRFAPVLQNTFLLGRTIIAVWTQGIYLGTFPKGERS